MATILVVDDRAAERKKVVDLAKLSLPKGSEWAAEGIDPLPTVEEYPSMLTEHDVAVLILDEKLNEQPAADTGASVQYSGHELVEYLRPFFPELPIFIVTGAKVEAALLDAASQVEGIINRREFGEEPKTHTARMIRSGQRFSEALKKDLSTLAELSQKVALGEATPENVIQLNGIREKLSIAIPSQDLVYAKDLIPKAEKLLETAQGLLEKIKGEKRK